ncbi:MAG TPA: DUF952 domain-containing protein [Jatrophihabitans sp.]|nr:DUF952 domain-containing protein [Jatrophihabitans sp.]
MSIYHIVAEADWRTACAEGSYRPPSLAEQGFVHFSHAHQVSRVANERYHDQDGLIVVEFDPGRLPAPVVEEDLYDAGEEFPHVYAAIPTQAAVAEHPLGRDDSGDYRFG